MRKLGVILAWILFLGALGAAYWAVAVPPALTDGPVTVVCMETAEDADCTLLYQDGAAILIDTGTEQDGARILEVLKVRGVERLDCMILTHPDGDHIGGALRILSQIPVDQVIQPYYTEENERLEELNDFCRRRNIPIVYPTHAKRLQAGQMQAVIYPPLEKHYKDTNNYSLAVLIQHGQVNMLFTGDALKKRSEELLYTDWPQVDLYKVPHHGRANSMTGPLFKALHPKYAVVTSDSADGAVTASCEKEGTVLFYTALGDCVFQSDGTTLTAKDLGGVQNERSKKE